MDLDPSEHSDHELLLGSEAEERLRSTIGRRSRESESLDSATATGNSSAVVKLPTNSYSGGISWQQRLAALLLCRRDSHQHFQHALCV